MGNNYSKEEYLYIFGTECLASTAIYWTIFWKLFAKCEFNGKSPKDCLSISTNTISTIHSVLMLSTFFDFFYYKRYESQLISEPHLTGHIWAIGQGYVIADTLAHLTLFKAFDKSKIPRRYDIMAHHMIGLPLWFITQWPTFKNAWAFFAPIYAVELTTIFLNLQWFGKYFKNKRLENISKILFAATWFPTRPVICIYCLKWLIENWKEMNENPEFPARAKIYMIISAFPMISLQLIWTVYIAWKLVKKCCFQNKSGDIISTPNKPTHLHGTSVEMDL